MKKINACLLKRRWVFSRFVSGDSVTWDFASHGFVDHAVDPETPLAYVQCLWNPSHRRQQPSSQQGPALGRICRMRPQTPSSMLSPLKGSPVREQTPSTPRDPHGQTPMDSRGKVDEFFQCQHLPRFQRSSNNRPPRPARPRNRP